MDSNSYEKCICDAQASVEKAVARTLLLSSEKMATEGLSTAASSMCLNCGQSVFFSAERTRCYTTSVIQPEGKSARVNPSLNLITC